MHCCRHLAVREGLAFAMVLLAGCGGPDHPPPPPLSFEGLPVSGSLADALNAGFTRCRADTTEMRCRRGGMMFRGFGPFSAAVDLNGNNGGGGFDQLTMWSDRDQNAAIPVGTALERQGWRSCYTGDGNWGDQAIYTHPDSPVRISIDISYWGKRRLRLIPGWNKRERLC
jgi:hypothetical protein